MMPHQQFPLRKSPRFSSSSSPPPSTPNLARSKARPDDAWALSLHVADPVPLKICYPSDEGPDKPLGRSSRFTANKFKTSPPKTDNVGDREKRRRLTDDREAVSKKTKLGSDNVVILRRSYRLKGGRHGKSAPQILALTDPPSKSAGKCLLSEKCLRSRSVLMHKVERVSTKESLGMLCLLGPSLVEHAPVKKSLDSSSVKCLRSSSLEVKGGNEKEKERSASKISNFSVKGKKFRSEETENSFVELPEKSRNPRRGSSLRRSHKDSDESPKLETSTFPIELGPPLVKHAPVKKSLNSSSDKCLRSRSLKVKGGNEKEKEKGASKRSDFSVNGKKFGSEETEYSLVELPEKSRNPRRGSSLRRSHKDSGESPKLEKTTFPIEKRLRSRSVKMQTQKDTSETGGSVIELPGERSTRILRRSHKDFGESSKTENLAPSPQLENGSFEKDGYELHEKRLIMSPTIESVLDELFGDYEERDFGKM